VSLISYGQLVPAVLDAAEALADEGVSAEVVDLQPLGQFIGIGQFPIRRPRRQHQRRTNLDRSELGEHRQRLHRRIRTTHG
jgi:hypothetical protein